MSATAEAQHAQQAEGGEGEGRLHQHDLADAQRQSYDATIGHSISTGEALSVMGTNAVLPDVVFL